MDEIIDSKSSGSNYVREKSLPNSTAVLVLGIISIATCWLYGLPGVICGIIALVLFNKDKKLYDESPEIYHTSFKNARAGQICAIIGLCLSALIVIYFILVFVFIGTFLGAASTF